MNKSKMLVILLAGVIALSLTGCVKPVEPKVLVNAESNETMFVIPLVGENRDTQAKLDSADYYNKQKVAVKQIQIPHRWLQTGRDWNSAAGVWVPSVTVIKVNRTPVTAEFSVSDKNNAKKDADAIWVESADSVGFSTGFTVTGFIEEADTAIYLYRYPSSDLKTVIATEVRARIQQGAADFCAKYPLDTLRAKKNEMVTAIRADVVPFYKSRGITISAVGQFGGMTYENPDIQRAIDAVFIAQQEKEKAAAALAAVKDINARSESQALQDAKNARNKADGEADALLTVAKANASGKLAVAQADAAGIQAVANATKEAATNPIFLEVRKLDVQKVMYERWNGSVPNMIMGSGQGGTGVNVFLPHTPESAASGVTFK
jgi:hypothetical protein